MSKHFFITGHQRCRTAWLSNLFTTESTFCHHDATCRMASPPHLEDVVEGSSAYSHVGDADTGLPAFPEALDYFYAIDRNMPVAIIHRPLGEVRKSLFKMFWEDVAPPAVDKSITLAASGLAEISEGPNVMNVDFSQLSDIGMLDELSQHLVGFSLKRDRVEALLGLNVQIHKPVYFSAMTEEFIEQSAALVGDI